MTEQIEAWHFVGETLRDGHPIPPDGEVLKHDGTLVMCESGLHASVRVIDALTYAPGNTICRVVLSGTIKKDTDKLVASERTILWRLDGSKLLRAFARRAALDVVHLWTCPPLVREYLETGKEEIRSAAEAAAEAAARAAARAAAWDAARAAARDAAGAAAEAAARVAAWDATRAAAWDAAWDAARDAAGAAAWAAAWDAARAAARAAAWDAARAAARDKYNDWLTEMVMAAYEEGK